MITVVLPKNISFYDWACQLNIDMPSLDIPLPPKDEKKWLNWAQTLFANNQNLLIQKGVPLPNNSFKTWKDWVVCFVENFN